MDNPQRLITFGDVHYLTESPERTDEGEEAIPNLRLRIQRPQLPWQRLSRKVMASILAETQASGGLVVCVGCGRALESEFMQLDHILPRAERGKNDISNRILLCGPCNGRKSAKLTLGGLRSENRKVGWMFDQPAAEAAQTRANQMAERVEIEWDTVEVEELVAEHG